MYSLNALVAQTVKNPPAMQETWLQSLGQKDPQGKEMATLENAVDRGAWQASLGGQRVGHK